jgi:hypothetical protein
MFVVRNAGTGALVYTIEITNPGMSGWITSASPETGISMDSSNEIEHTLTFGTSALPNGMYMGTITASTRSTRPDPTSVELPVVLTIEHAPEWPGTDPGIVPEPPAVPDADSDGIDDLADNCPDTANADQDDTDGDGVGDLCDNCILISNANQADDDNDGLGNACDNCPNLFGIDLNDVDGDGVGDVCDNCPDADNPDQADADQDGLGDACDPTPLPGAGQATPGSNTSQGGTTPGSGQSIPQTGTSSSTGQQESTGWFGPLCGVGVAQAVWIGLLGLSGLRFVNRRRRP